MRTKTAGRLLLVSAIALSAMTGPASAQEASVSAVDNEFDPAQLEVDAGTTVTWTNNGESPHTVTASDGSFDSGNLDPGQTFSHTFDEAGEFSYVCEYHEGDGMVGAISVAQSDDGNGGGNGAGNGGDDTGTTDPTAPETGKDEEPLPETGPEGVGAFLFLALVLIGAGGACLCLDRRPDMPQARSATQSRVR